MKNTLADLNNHLFAQIERLGDEGLSKDTEKLQAEIQRTEAMSKVATQIIDNAHLVLKAQLAVADRQITNPVGLLGIDK